MRCVIRFTEDREVLKIKKLLNSIIKEREDIEFFEKKEVINNMFLDKAIYNFKTNKLIFRIKLNIDKKNIIVKTIKRIINNYKNLSLYEFSNKPFLYIIGKTFISLKQLVIKFNVNYEFIKENREVKIKTYKIPYRKDVVLELKYKSDKTIVELNWLYKNINEDKYNRFMLENLNFFIKKKNNDKDNKLLNIYIERNFKYNGYRIYLTKNFSKTEIGIMLDKDKEIIKYIKSENEENSFFHKYSDLDLDISDYKLYDKLLNQIQNDVLIFLKENEVYKLIRKYYQISNIIENILLFLIL